MSQAASATAPAPAARRGRGLFAGLNPASRVIGLLVLTVPLLVSVDWVSASVALAAILIASPACGVGWLELARRSWPILAMALLGGVSMMLYARPEGEVYFELGLAKVTDNSIELSVAIVLRVLAVALPVMVLIRDIDPTDLGDALAQVLKLPHRFVISVVAGTRMVVLFRDDWAAMERARRARGLGDRGRIRRAAGQCFALLVLALRRGGRLSTAMEARGFGRAGQPRTWARRSVMTWRDALAILACAAVPAVAIGVAVATGEFRFLGA
ncbi:energy-coupling factor transporter transmembrane component T family protein [Corynebacterium otitidis]|uniref:Cobalt/nickel transport system permease protein n=1 Tax=Corynebacterium otitidis ATCC 51513 TaxID=883169 RepID=I7KJ11_9CORY|nr:hypothetical protein HMPREF9719_00990 [Corynebacterium otitidis ATCC 51513]CCI83290.1 cobalt/nickel transport system permease protein [Corynebacterium otitidis ATCC 51513]